MARPGTSLFSLSFVSLASLTALGACGDDLSTVDRDAVPDAPVVPGPDDNAVAPGVGLAVVNSDFVTTSLSLLDATGQVTHADCITSGTRPPGSTLALSGDVVLPSQPQAGNLVLALDRTNSALTWIDPSNCAPLRQLDVSTGYFANPHDVVSISATKAYVARYELNPTPTPDTSDRDEGDDLLIIDPSVPSIIGRIDLASYAVAVAGTTIQARPDRALLIGGKVYVALSNLSGDFQTAGHGRLVVIDPATDQVTGTIDIPQLDNCSSLSYVESTQTFAVACAGSFASANQAARSGIAYIDLAAATPAVVRYQDAAPFGTRPLADFSVIAQAGALGFGVTFGEFGGTPTDQLWALDVAAGTATEIAASSEAFTFGNVLIDRSHQRVYVTDANADAPRVRPFAYATGGAPAALTPINASPTTGLPPRQILWY